MSENERNFIMVVVEMTKPYAILFLSEPKKNEVMETLGNLILQGNKDLDECFTFYEFNITEDIQGVIEDE